MDEREDVDAGLEADGVGLVTPETEMKFLTLSWWVLYVGWKDVGERVRKSVEEVFEG
jgi:peroxin-3